MTTPDTLMDLIRQAVPPNIVQATMQQYRTGLIKPPCKDNNCSAYFDDENQLRDPADPLTWRFKGKPLNQQRRPLSRAGVCSGEWTSGSNILGLITFAIILGVSLAKLGEKGREI